MGIQRCRGTLWTSEMAPSDARIWGGQAVQETSRRPSEQVSTFPEEKVVREGREARAYGGVGCKGLMSRERV